MYTVPKVDVLVSGTVRSGYSDPIDANSILMKFAPDGRLRVPWKGPEPDWNALPPATPPATCPPARDSPPR